MTKEQSPIRYPEGTPWQNFSRGLYQVDLPPTFGEPTRGKVRDNWQVDVNGRLYRVMVTTDRQSAFDRIIGTVPNKGAVLNRISDHWFGATQDLIPNHVVEVPHNNVLIAREAKQPFPIEVVVRRYMAKTDSSTSVYRKYMGEGRRNIYGIDFPNDLKPNQEFPMGTIVTPTTKAKEGHDEELTEHEAKAIVESQFGEGVWDRAKEAALTIFERARALCLQKGLILVDTKFEFGLDEAGEPMLIDEILSPDSSRFWLAETYKELFLAGKDQRSFDKEILRRWLSERGFSGEGPIPVVEPYIFDQMGEAYKEAYRMITDQNVAPNPTDPEELQAEIVRSIEQFFEAAA